jgi:hypothetical protein
MDTTSSVVLAAIITLVLVIAVAYAWYGFVGWSDFSYSAGDSPAWAPAPGKSLARLRFKDCVFTVRRGDGKTATFEASAVLNGMAVAYASAVGAPPPVLTLDRPLNPFSFVITGFNDRASVPDPGAAPWCTSPPAACASDAGCPGGKPGSCVKRSSGAACVTCPGGATVTLVGKVRTI